MTTIDAALALNPGTAGHYPLTTHFLTQSRYPGSTLLTGSTWTDAAPHPAPEIDPEIDPRSEAIDPNTRATTGSNSQPPKRCRSMCVRASWCFSVPCVMQLQQMMAKAKEANPTLLADQGTRKARRLYVGNLPIATVNVTEQMLVDFFNAAVGVCKARPCSSVAMGR